MLWHTGEDKMINGLILALQFLTRIPINKNIDFNHENIRKSTYYFPYVGILLGALAALSYYAFLPFNKDIASFIAVLMIIFLTGGLHLDGLSDTADGFYSARDKEKMLVIMKDSRIGAFGVISLILIILFKYIIISNLDNNVGLVLILSLGNSRLVALIQMAYKKTARPGGLGELFSKSNPKKYILFSIIQYVIIISIINIKFLIPLIGTIILGELITRITYKKIDGFTGDVYGATIELCEALSLLLFMGVLQWI